MEFVPNFLVPLVANVGLLSLLAWGISFYGQSLFFPNKSLTTKNRMAIGALFGLTAALLMYMPIEYQPGFIADAQGGPLLISGLIGGPIAAVITVGIAALARYQTGGQGMVGGIVFILVFGTSGLIMYYNAKIRKPPFVPTLPRLLLLATVGTTAALPLILTFPAEKQLPILINLWPALFVSNVLGVLILGGLLIRGREVRENVKRKTLEGQLNKTLGILNETGSIAKVGGWELDVATSQLTWTDETFRILEVEKKHDQTPVLPEGLDLFTPGSKPIIERAVQRAIEHGEPYDLELEALTAKGNVVWIYTNGKPNYENGEIISLSGTIQDINTRKLAELNYEVERQKGAQNAKLASLGQLTGGVAHDFNNLLAVMIGSAEMLLLKESENDNSRKHIDEIIHAVDRASSLTSRLLAFSRQQVLTPVSCDVSDHIENLVEMLQRTLGETIDLKFVHTPDLWPALIDPHQFEDALVNLALNARDAMPEGGALTIEAVNVTLDNTYVKQYEEVLPGEYVKVAVSDNGVGMTPEVSAKVFEPFYTTKEVGQGSGLGLSMVFGFAKQSDGHVTIYSEVGHGTTVNLYMPSTNKSAVSGNLTNDEKTEASGSERILVVEDDENVRRITVSILTDQGYEIVSAVDGNEAIEHLKGDTVFGLLFTDVILPGGLNGVDIAKQAEQLQPNIKVLYTTGYAENSILHSGRLDRSVTLLNKPYRRAELLEQVRLVLDQN